MSAAKVPMSKVHLTLLLTAAVYLCWSGVHPAGRFNWFMETLPAVAGIPLLVIVYPWFRFTTVTYCLIWFFSLILMTGGHYTYAEVPIGNWFRDTFHLSRNHFDRFGHFFQGVIPAMLARELLVRTSPLRPGFWLLLCCTSISLSISAGYELFEWQYAIHAGGAAANDFLGSQGDIWDAQEDMFMALLGAMSSLLFLGKLQNRQLAGVQHATAD